MGLRYGTLTDDHSYSGLYNHIITQIKLEKGRTLFIKKKKKPFSHFLKIILIAKESRVLQFTALGFLTSEKI